MAAAPVEGERFGIAAAGAAPPPMPEEGERRGIALGGAPPAAPTPPPAPARGGSSVALFAMSVTLAVVMFDDLILFVDLFCVCMKIFFPGLVVFAFFFLLVRVLAKCRLIVFLSKS